MGMGSENPTVAQWHCTATFINPLNIELNPICYMLALLQAHPILHVSRIRFKYEIKEFIKTIILKF